jgi:hypothetical protein
MPAPDGRSRKACCLISEFLEETGLDRAQLRKARKQILQGIVLLCQWQLERMREPEPAAPAGRKSRKVPVE